MDISRNVFIPKPNVDSIVLSMTKRNNKEEIKNIDIFYKLIRDSFQFKRKNLRNNLKNYDLIKIEEILKKYGFDLNSRAEQINYRIFIEIANELSKK
jgi:16S rRNA (adenine1518-N6/adenine1519-N6)-dimethyltransferase